MILSRVLAHPSIAVALTVISYAFAQRVHRWFPWAAPIVIGCLPIVTVLRVLHVSYTDYNRGGSYLTWWLGPATVALAVPMYRNGLTLRGVRLRLAVTVMGGSLTGILTAAGVAKLLGAPLPIVLSSVPKSVTTPIAIEVSRQLGGIPQITIAMVILSGVLGATIGKLLLMLVGVKDDRAIGAAIGTSSHGIGTASLIRDSEIQSAVSSWAMASAGVFTAVISAFLRLFLH
ncbi:MAG: LrgB family protein [Acidobacteria bacterium]|nr:LrgB family protein [Acidobacteriota bacterium]